VGKKVGKKSKSRLQPRKMANLPGSGVSALALILIVAGLGASRNYIGTIKDRASGATVSEIVMGTRDWCSECDNAAGACVAQCENYWSKEIEGNEDGVGEAQTAQGCSRAAFAFFFIGMLLNCGQTAQYAMDMEAEMAARAVSAATTVCYLLALILAIAGPSDYIDYQKNMAGTVYAPDWVWGASVYLYIVAFIFNLCALAIGICGIGSRDAGPPVEAKMEEHEPHADVEPGIPSSAGAVMGAVVTETEEAPTATSEDQGKV